MLDDESYLNPDFFYITNPNLGRSTHIRYLVNKYEQAKENGDDSVQIFLAKYLNVEIGLNKRSDRWAGADFWMLSAYKDKLFIESILDLSEICTIGFDGGGFLLTIHLGVSSATKGAQSPPWIVAAQKSCA